jgi:tetratricopeptide (TPR) repeat protein
VNDDWDTRVQAVWDDDALSDDERIDRIDALAGERAPNDARALFERAGALDSAGREAQAEPLYRAALAARLDETHRPQAVIQLASTLRNLGAVDEAIGMLRSELDRSPVSPLRDEAAAFLALALAARGDHDEALALALRTLAPHLRRYTRSVQWYAGQLAREG